MAIPEEQLDTWSHQGSIAQSCATYNTIKNVLESADSAYADKNYTVFLQGSYGNDTNIYSESDVDIVIRLDSCFYHDLESLPEDQKATFNQGYPNASYGYFDFRKDVIAHLEAKYGRHIQPGNKAIKIQANGSRRNADVLIAAEYRRYYKFNGLSDQSYDSGICFWDAEMNRIANYPKQHSNNCTIKHQATNGGFKPLVRILKNMRGKIVEYGMLAAGVAPSYYLEGLLYNVPNEQFGKNYQETFINSINWILEADRSKFVCANEQYYLLHESSRVTWRAEQCSNFLAAVCDLWNQW